MSSYKTRAQLLEENEYLKRQNMDLSYKIRLVEEAAKAMALPQQVVSTLTVALERTTESVAHVLSDLKRRVS